MQKKCAGKHKTDNCVSTFLYCVNCLKVKVSFIKPQGANSPMCLILIKEPNLIQKQTNCIHMKKKNNQVLLARM